MAGEQFLRMIKSRGGTDSDYADFLYGTVMSTDPLTIQLSNQMPLTEAQLILGRHVTKHKEKMTVYIHSESFNFNEPIGSVTGTRATVTEEVEIDQSLKEGDMVMMIRGDGGQQFYVVEKLTDEAKDKVGSEPDG